MARKAPFWVAIPDRPEFGYPVTVTPHMAGGYGAVAKVTSADHRTQVRVSATILRNEAGFAGRQWELLLVNEPGDTQHATLRAAAQALGIEAARRLDATIAVKAAMRPGLRPFSVGGRLVDPTGESEAIRRGIDR